MYNPTLLLKLHPRRIYKGKGEVHPTRGHEGPKGDEKYNSTLT